MHTSLLFPSAIQWYFWLMIYDVVELVPLGATYFILSLLTF